MSRRRPAPGQYPPDFLKAAEGRHAGDPLADLAASPWGALRLYLWRKVPDATPIEVEWAMSPRPRSAKEAVERVVALRDALEVVASEYPDLAATTADDLYRVSPDARTNGGAVVDHLLRLTTSRVPLLPRVGAEADGAVPGEVQGRRDRVVTAHRRWVQRHDGQPPMQVELAEMLGVTDRLLRTWRDEDPWLSRYVRTRRPKTSG